MFSAIVSKHTLVSKHIMTFKKTCLFHYQETDMKTFHENLSWKLVEPIEKCPSKFWFSIERGKQKNSDPSHLISLEQYHSQHCLWKPCPKTKQQAASHPKGNHPPPRNNNNASPKWVTHPYNVEAILKIHDKQNHVKWLIIVWGLALVLQTHTS